MREIRINQGWTTWRTKSAGGGEGQSEGGWMLIQSVKVED